MKHVRKEYQWSISNSSWGQVILADRLGFLRRRQNEIAVERRQNRQAMRAETQRNRRCLAAARALHVISRAHIFQKHMLWIEFGSYTHVVKT